MLLEAAIQEWILARRADGIRDTTLSTYRSIIGTFSRANEGKLLEEISAHDMREYLLFIRQHYASEHTRADHNRVLQNFWSWAQKEYTVPNPMRNISYPNKPQPIPRAASIDDIKAMFAAAGKGTTGVRNRAILAFLLDTGARAAGVVGLKMVDLDMEKRRALVTEKGNKTRGVVFSSYTAALLSEWLAVRSPVATVFYNVDTLNPLTPHGLYQLTKRLARRAGVRERFNPHAFRHTFAKEYLLAGGDLATLSKILGHRDVSTTVNNYTVFTDREIREKHDQYTPVSKLLENDDE